MNIILTGKQGAGKGIQSGNIKEHYNMRHVSMGDELKKTMQSGSPQGEQIKQLIDQGNLVPDEITISILQSILKEEKEKGIILDGFPRTLNQAEQLQNIINIDAFLFITISDEEAIKRISARRMCIDCNANYNIIYIQPQQEGICDKCGGKLIQRDDDTPDAVKNRLLISHKNLAPIKEFYEKKGIVHEINGEQTIPAVFEDIKKVLDTIANKE